MPGCLLDHLTKAESLRLLLLSSSNLKWLVLDKVDHLLDGGSFGGQVKQTSSGFAGASTAQWGVGAARVLRSVLMLVTADGDKSGQQEGCPGGVATVGVGTDEGARPQQRGLQELGGS
jgi:hypothetical protein